jgi:hypothetical protein
LGRPREAAVDITLQFSTSKGWASALIRWETWSKYSHVDLVMPDGRLLGARLDGGVQIREMNYADFTKIKRMVASVTNSQGIMLYALAHKQLGLPYQKKSILGFAIRKDGASTGSWFCSELIAWLFDKIGHPLTFKPVNRVSPEDLIVSPQLKEETWELHAAMQ